jgi:TonB-dependent starch-binding outer membrane protein SusC
MKKRITTIVWGFEKYCPQKTILIMKLTTLLLFINFIHIGAAVTFQNDRFTYKTDKIQIMEFLDKIESESKYKFLYRSEHLKTVFIKVDAKNATLEELLASAFSETNITYKVLEDNLIVITQKEPNASSQQQKITGKITDATTGESLPGVSIVIEGTGTGVTSDADGKFSINIPDAYSQGVLLFTYMGYLPEKVQLPSQAQLDVKITPNVKKLDDVVIIGYGTVKKGNVSGSVSKINSGALADRPINRVEQALYGEMAGVQVRTTSGEPGQAIQVRVRGSASISASKDPLYVIDGVPVSSLADVNANDIQSMEVLKDAASAAIYGSRGANGVVLITTKGGKKGTNFQFTYRTGVQMIEKKIPLMGAQDWINMQKQILDTTYLKWGVTNKVAVSVSDNSYQRTTKMGYAAPKNYPTAIYDPRWDYGQDSLQYVDWQDEFYRVAKISEYNLSASGGNENLSYRISGSYLDQDAIVVFTNYKRANLRANVEAKKGHLTYGVNLAPSISWYNGGGISGKDAQSHHVLTMAPVVEQSAGLNTGADGNAIYSWATSNVSPIAYLREQTNETAMYRLLSSTYINGEITKGLNLRVQGAMNMDNSNNQIYRPTSIMASGTQTAGSKSYGNQANSINMFYSFESTLNYNATFGKHYINAVAGYTTEKNKNKSTTQTETNGFSNDALTDFDYSNTSGATTISKTNSYSTMLISYLGRVIYTYNNKYQLQASVRTDGSSKFGANKRWGTFPSVGTFWRVSEEPFFQPVTKLLNEFKLRYSWGMTGNNTLTAASTTDGNIYPAIGTLESNPYSFNGTTYTGYGPSSTSNPNLGWEKTSASNFGIDIGFLQSRISLSADYYYKVTTDLLLQVPVPIVTGNENEWQNIGHVKNTGFEVELTSNNLVKALKWTTTLTLSQNKNTVTKLGPDNAPIYSGLDATSNASQIIKVGEALDAFYMYDAIGVYMNQTDLNNSPHMSTNVPGDVKYRDVNGDGKIDSDDRTILGHKTPDFTYGMTNTFSWKNFDLSFLIMGQSGGKIYNILGRAFDRPGMGSKTNALEHWKNRWISADQPGDGKTPSITSTATTSLIDSRWLYDASYWKLKSMTIGYTIPVTKLKGLLSGARIYVSGENIFMHDHYDGGYSPESDNNNGGDYGAYPQAKTFIAGININF